MLPKRNDPLLLMIVIIICTLASCTKKFDSINTPWSGSPTANVQQLYAGFVSNLALTYSDQSNDNGWIYPITQQGMVYTKPDYPITNGAGDDWNNYYHNLSNYNSMIGIIASSPDSATFTNIIAMMKVLKAYQTIKVTNFFGDMPYSQAGKATNYSAPDYTPVYDKQQSIYLASLNDLDWAINNFNASDVKQYSLGTSEFVLLNNIPKWIEFANSLRLRIAVTMYDKDQTDARPQITAALSKPLLDADNTNVGLYSANIPSMDLSGRQWAFYSEGRIRMGTTMWQWMSSNNNQDGSGIFDPRCRIFFEPNNDSLWNPYPQNPTPSTPAEAGDPYNRLRDNDWANKNGNPPTPNLYADFNYFIGKDTYIPELFMTAAEVHFLKAEIYARGLGVAANAANAQTEYYAGVTTSVNFWVGEALNSPEWIVNRPSGLPSPAAMTAFLANPVVHFDAANLTTHGLRQIYAQEWIDLFRQPWEAWTLQRRTGGLTPMDPNNSSYYAQTYGGYNRYQYPGSEQTYNFKNWFAETNGNDQLSTKIWIEK